MNNLDFFKACWNNEKMATVAMIQALPSDKLVYQPHPVNRTAREIVSHLLSHMVDFKTILQSNTCDETLEFDFLDSAMAAYQLDIFWKEVSLLLNNTSLDAWENETVELLIEGKTFVTLSRSSMMWFFFFDMIHHPYATVPHRESFGSYPSPGRIESECVALSTYQGGEHQEVHLHQSCFYMRFGTP
jgi:uncharacterized damage-inducible protein DinB